MTKQDPQDPEGLEALVLDPFAGAGAVAATIAGPAGSPVERATPPQLETAVDGEPVLVNHIAEWFGHRVYPVVAAGQEALADQLSGRCPFLSTVVGEEKKCIKKAASQGVCSISSTSNGRRQDWLVCPVRVMDTDLLEAAAARLFGHGTNDQVLLLAASALVHPGTRQSIETAVSTGRPVVVYFQAKAGGEISMSRTAQSPEFSFDFTMIEIVADDNEVTGLGLGRYGILEVQTMDFHGSYKHGVTSLNHALDLYARKKNSVPEAFHRALAENPEWGAERIEGPNISNVFKRTFYQMMFKFQLGKHPTCAGTVLALPQPVWDSWRPHLANPEFVPRPDGSVRFRDSKAATPDDPNPAAWIFVFDVTESASVTPNEVRVTQVIATDAETFSYHALERAPQAALGEGGAASQLMATIQKRLGKKEPAFRRRRQARPSKSSRSATPQLPLD